DVPDVAAAGAVGAGPVEKGLFKPCLIKVADGLPNEMAAPDRPVPVHENDRRPTAAAPAEAGGGVGGDPEQRVDSLEPPQIFLRVVTGPVLVGVDPKVDVPGKLAPKGPDLLPVLLQADRTHAEPHPPAVQFQAPGQEAGPADLGGVERRPQRQPA